MRRGARVHVAMTGTYTAARILALARPGLTVVPRGGERDALARIPVDVLAWAAGPPESESPSGIAVFKRWGLKTLGEIECVDGEIETLLGIGRKTEIGECNSNKFHKSLSGIAEFRYFDFPLRAAFSAIRALTSCFTNVVGSG